MEKIIPILPCQSIKEQVIFYENLGFETNEIYTSPNPYAVMKYGDIEMHFYGSKRTIPSENPQMCYLRVDDVNSIYEKFTFTLKKNIGKVPRSGIPRISKLKDLSSDRRFNITDVGGNTLFIGTPITELSSDTRFYRTLESKEYSKDFEILYDLIYSKEDSQVAFNMLTKFFPEDLCSLKLGDLDLAKILLVGLDIHLQKNKRIDEEINHKLKELLDTCQNEDSNWEKILQNYNDIINGE
ncbi:hypothetical protein [Clostridium sp.]|uniref:hypothetical protein n=1 Tax=Clostridium sp. TaxID=1506 RepID=UPI002FC7DE05